MSDVSSVRAPPLHAIKQGDQSLSTRTRSNMRRLLENAATSVSQFMAQAVSSILLDFLSPHPLETAITSSRMDANLLFHSEVLASTSPVIISQPTPTSRPGIAVRRQALLCEESASFIPLALHALAPPTILRTSLLPSSLEAVTPANADRSRIPVTSSIPTLILPPAQEARQVRTTTVTFLTHFTSLPQVALSVTAAVDCLIPAPSRESKEYLRQITHLLVNATTTTAPLPAMKSVLEPTQSRLNFTSFTTNPTPYP